MVVTNPLDKINDMLADDSDSEYRRSVAQEEELCSNPSDGERGLDQQSPPATSPKKRSHLRMRGLDQLSLPETSPENGIIPDERLIRLAGRHRRPNTSQLGMLQLT
jgi:hypothetical protein